MGTAVRAGFAATLIVALSAANGCSFLIDFPSEQSSGGSGVGGNGGAGGGDTGGGGTGGSVPLSCFGVATATSDKVEWEATPFVAGPDETVAITGLTYESGQQKVYAYGNTTYGLLGLNIPTATGDLNQLFVVSLHEGVLPATVLSGLPCGFTAAGELITKRIAAYPPFGSEVFVGGAIPATQAMTELWSIAPLETTACSTADAFTVAGPNPVSNVPFTANTDAGTVFHAVTGIADGVVLDSAFDATSEFFATVGGAVGAIFETSVSAPTFFVNLVDFAALETETQTLDTLFMNSAEPHATWAAGVAVDPAGTAWFAGSSCGVPDGCADPQMFFGLSRYGEAPTILVAREGGVSAATTVRYADERVVVGGRYQGTFSFLGETLPDAGAMIPFVAAFDSTNVSMLWTYPAEGSAPAASASEWRSVVDVAVLGTKDCGAVYVTGCVAPTTGTVDCTTFEAGKTGFATKLDLTTGAVIWTTDFALPAPASDLFIPTAIAAGDDSTDPGDEHVWLAATYSGTIDVFGQSAMSGLSRESIVVRLTP